MTNMKHPNEGDKVIRGRSATRSCLQNKLSHLHLSDERIHILLTLCPPFHHLAPGVGAGVCSNPAVDGGAP